MATKVSIERGMQASRPILAYVSKVVSSLPETSYVVYCRNHMHEEEEVYKNIDQLKELFLPKHELQLKIVNFEKGEQPAFISSSNFQCENNKLLIEFKYLNYTIAISGTVLNQSESNEGVVNLSVAQKKGYDDFYKFRKKYKTLENITKKIDFQIDHRLKLLIGDKEHQFDLEDKKREHYFLNLQSFAQQVVVILEETSSVENFVQVEKVEQVEVDMRALTEGQFSYRATVQFSNKFEVTFSLDLIKNQNLSAADFVAIRVLQSSIKTSAIKIGTEQTIHLADCLKVHPLVGSTFFDYEWGYLNENLSKIQGSNSYEFLQKITRSVPKYAHFANQEMIDLKSSNFLIFSIDGTIIKVPNIYILKGFNYVEHQKFSIKFYVDSTRLESKSTEGEKRNCKRIYQMSIEQIWNMNKLNKILDKTNSNNFSVKIVNEDTYYYIPFVRKTVARSQFRKVSKELLMRNQVTQLSGNKYYSLENSTKNKEQLTLIESASINPFYLIKFTSSSPLSVQLIVDNAIALEGSLSKDKIQSQAGKQLIHLLTSLDGNSKIGFILNFTEISQPADSAATYYNFKHQLSLAEPGESGEVTYDVEVQFEKESKLKSLRNKISPASKRQASEGIVLKEFSGHSGVYRKEETLSFTLKIKKMYFNEEMNYFDNEALLTKTVTINPTAELLREGKNVMVRLEKECYESLEFDLYDSNIKKRMKYFLQVYAQKNEFLDYKDSSYKIKIPPLLWNFNRHHSQAESTSFEICTHLNRRNKNTDKFTFTQNFNQEIVLDHYNYNDGISIVESGKMAYSKFLKAIKLKCDILKDKIGWTGQSEWYFGVLCFPASNFYFLAQRMFDPFEDKRKSESGDSRKTISRERSNRSDKHKIDPLAKTISNLDLFKLKQKKNQLVAEGRQLTARYVKRQEKIVELTKKLAEMEQAIRKKEQQERQVKADRKKVKKQNVKMKEFYRIICECGALNPQFNGYCDACLKKLKQSYEIYMKQYKEKCYEYEKMVFDKFNKKEKIQKMKRRIANMKSQNVVEEAEEDNPHLLIKDLEEKSLKKSIEELQVQIFQLQEEKNSLVATSNWQMSVLQEKIAKQDEAIYKASQQYDSLKNKLADLTKTIKTFNNQKE